MKKTTLALMITLFFSATVMFSCSKDSSDSPATAANEVSFVVNGGGYSNQTIKLNANGSAVYDDVLDATGCSFADAASNSAMVAFNGHATGTFAVNDDNGLVVNMDNNTTLIGLTSGTITVTQYGAVGSDIKGTFSGTGIVIKNLSDPDTIQITNGNFKARRAM